MPQNTNLVNPQTKALIATVIVVLLLGGFSAVGFWYGLKRGEKATNTTTNTATAQATNTTTSPNARTVTGTVSKVSTNELEVSQTLDGTTQTVLAKISATTKIQKWDYRTSISKDKGVTIKLADVRTGSQVIITTTDTENSPINADGVKMVIYP
jgi:uncharacterized protein HemX